MKRNVLSLVIALLAAVSSYAQLTVEGTVLYHFKPEYPVEGVIVGLYNEQGQVLAFDQTGADGVFSFENVAPGNYTCKATTDLEGADATLQQAFLIWLHTLGYIQFSDIQKLAADVDGSANVNFFDVRFIVVNYFIYNQPYPAGEWKFTELQVTAGAKEGGGAIGSVKVTDVEGVFVPVGRNGHIVPDQQHASLLGVSPGQVVRIPVGLTGAQSTSGYGIVLDYNPELVEVLNVIPVDAETNYTIDNHQLRLSSMLFDQSKSSPADATLFEVEVRLLQDLPVGTEVFRINPRSHILDGDGMINENVSLSIPLVKTSNQEQFALFYPNPFVSETTLSYVSEEAHFAQINVFDVAGKMVYSSDLLLGKGTSETSIDLEHLHAGAYHIVLKDIFTQKVLHKQAVIKQ